MSNDLKQVQVKEHCHKHAKFVKLSDDQQQKLGLLQEASESKGNNNNNNNSQVSSLHSKVDELTTNLEHLAAAASAKLAEEEDDKENDDDWSNTVANGTNSFLQPQRKSKKGNGWNPALAFVEDKGIKVRGVVKKEVRFSDAVVARMLKSMSSNWVIQSNHSVKAAGIELSLSRSESDNHDNTCVVGKNVCVFADCEQPCSQCAWHW